MHQLSFDILQSPSSNDHQVRIRIDETDWLGDDHLGIDPPAFFNQESLIAGGELLVGRCNCGCEGCGDVRVVVLREGDEVKWTKVDGLCLQFHGVQYDSVIKTATEDFSWEDTNRTAERLVSDVFEKTVLGDGYLFDWASARVRDGAMSLSFSKSGVQKLLEFPWDGRSPQEALKAAKIFAEKVSN